MIDEEYVVGVNDSVPDASEELDSATEEEADAIRENRSPSPLSHHAHSPDGSHASEDEEDAESEEDEPSDNEAGGGSDNGEGGELSGEEDDDEDMDVLPVNDDTVTMDLVDDEDIPVADPAAQDIRPVNASIMAGSMVIEDVPSPSSSHSSRSRSNSVSTRSPSPGVDEIGLEVDAAPHRGRPLAKGSISSRAQVTVDADPVSVDAASQLLAIKTQAIEQDLPRVPDLNRDEVDQSAEDIEIDEPSHEDDPEAELESDLQPAHRAEALDVLATIELKFALLRERVYVEKMDILAWEEGLVDEGKATRSCWIYQTDRPRRHASRTSSPSKRNVQTKG
jgi:hypothetical protein